MSIIVLKSHQCGWCGYESSEFIVGMCPECGGSPGVFPSIMKTITVKDGKVIDRD